MDTSLTNKGAVSKSRRARPAAPIYLPPALRKEQQNANDSDTIQHVAQTNNKNTVKPKVQSEVISSQNNSLILERFKNEMESMKEQSTSVNSNQHNDLILGRLSSEDQILNEKSDNGENQNRKPKYIPCSNCFLSYKYDKSGTEKLPYSKNICNICKDELKNKPKPVIHDSNKNYSQQLNEGKLEISNLTAKHCSHSYNKSEEPFKISNDIPNVTNENNSKVRNTSDSLSEYCSKNKQILDLLLANCTNVASIPDILIKNSPAGTNLMDWLLDNYPDVNLSNYPDLISELFIGAESILRDFANLKIEVPKMAPEIKSTLSKDSSKLVADHVAELRTIPDMFKSNISNLTLENNEKAINNTNSSAEISLKINIFEDISKITTVNITDNKFNLDNENDAKTTRSLNRAVDDLEISKISNVSVEPCSQSTLSCNNFQMDDSTKEIKSKTCKESTNSEVKELETRYQTQIGVHAEQEQTVKNVNLNVCIIDKSKKTDRKCDTDQAEMVRASEEINRRNKRIMKHLLNKSDMLIITDQNSEIGDTECKKNKTNGFDISNESDVEAAVDNWEDLLSEEKSIDNIIYKSKSKYPKKIHPTNESNIDDQPNNETLEGEGDLSHVIEIYNFPEEFQTRDLLAIFDSLKMTNYSIKWVDETHALGVFNSGYAANEVIKMKHPLIKVRPIAEASKQSKSKVKRYPNAMVPNAVRPQTCPQTARRMVTGALGIKLTNAKEERAKEIQILKDARAMKKLKAKLEDEAWEGKLVSK